MQKNFYSFTYSYYSLCAAIESLLMANSALISDELYQNCTNGSALLSKGATRAPDKKYL